MPARFLRRISSGHCRNDTGGFQSDDTRAGAKWRIVSGTGFRSVRGVVINFSAHSYIWYPPRPVGSFVRHRYVTFSPFSSLSVSPSLSLCLSLFLSYTLSSFSALSVFLFRFPGRETHRTYLPPKSR